MDILLSVALKHDNCWQHVKPVRTRWDVIVSNTQEGFISGPGVDVLQKPQEPLGGVKCSSRPRQPTVKSVTLGWSLRRKR